jgi:hypothetical protein
MQQQANPYDSAFQERMAVSKELGEGGGLGFFKGNLQGVNFWKCAEADHDLDIIPYLAGPNDPYREEGKITYVLELFEHRDVGGIEGQSFICMEKTYMRRGALPDGRPFKGSCPVCQHRQQLIQEGADEDLIKALRTSRYPRSIYNVVVYDSETEQAKGVQVWHTSHYLMEQYLLKLSESSRREIEQGMPPRKNFIDPTAGYSVKFTRSGQGINTRYYGHTLVPRNYQITQTTLDQAHVLDGLIHLPTYDEVYKAYWGQEPDRTPAVGGQPVGTPAMARGMVATPPAPTTAPVSPQTPPPGVPTPAPAAPVTPAPVVGGHVQPAPAPPVSGAPAPAAVAPAAGAPAATGAPAAPATGSGALDPATGQPYVCPGGGQFGVNTMELQHCEQCHIFQPCVDENERLLAAQPGAAAPGPAVPATPVGPAATPPPVTGAPVAPPGTVPGPAPAAPPGTVPGGVPRTPVGTTRGEPVGTGPAPTPGGRALVK